MPADVEQVEREVVLIKPVVAEAIPAELGRWREPPARPDRPLQGRRQKRAHVVRRLPQLAHQVLLAVHQPRQVLRLLTVRVRRLLPRRQQLALQMHRLHQV